MFRKYDSVRSIIRIDDAVPAGSPGVVLIIYDASPAVYEVEFFDADHNSIALSTVRESDIEKRIPDDEDRSRL